MPIEWRPQMSVGHSAIDDDHKKLLEIINGFEASARGPNPAAGLSEVLKRLLAYAKEHFAREQALQARIGFPYADAHADEHRALLAVIEQKARSWFVLRDRDITDESVDEMSAVLRRWLVDHIMQHDMRMKPYIDEAKRRAGKAASA